MLGDCSTSSMSNGSLCGNSIVWNLKRQPSGRMNAGLWSFEFVLKQYKKKNNLDYGTAGQVPLANNLIEDRDEIFNIVLHWLIQYSVRLTNL